MKAHHVLILLGFSLFFSSSYIYAKSVKSECKRISNKLSSVSYKECISRQLQMSDGRSVRGAPLSYKEYAASQSESGRIMIIGGIHGDEYSSVSVVFKWLRILDKYPNGLFHWHVVPVANPDGLLQRRSSRMNAHGVDLNRNFPSYDWQEKALSYWYKRTRKNKRRYPGKTAASEPETKWLISEIERFKPDIIVSVHAPYDIIDYDGPKKAPNRLGHLNLRLLGTYPGSLGRYAGVDKNIPVVTVELTHAGIMPSKKQISHIWTDLVLWLKKNVPSQTVKVMPKRNKHLPPALQDS